MKKALLCLLFISTCSIAQISLPDIFGDHMVLQQRTSVKIWGWGTPLEKVKLQTSWDQKTYETETNNLAKWQIDIQTPAAGGPFQIKLNGYNEVLLDDILIGEVWLASGQSNMEWSANSGIDEAAKHIGDARNEEVRFFEVVKRSSKSEQENLSGKWQVCSPESMQNFSAVAYFFGNKLQKELKIPFGLIQSAWGGTPAEAWMSEKAFDLDPQLSEVAKMLPEQPWGPQKPQLIYNAMIAPLIHFNIAGVIWYQGESNTSNAAHYAHVFSALIKDWREQWQKDFPFYYVQIAPYDYGEGESGVVVRNEQRKVSLDMANTAMVVVSDIGNTKDIHPKNKNDVGWRLADQALAKHYQFIDKTVDGPVLDKIEKEKNRLVLTFKNAEGLSFTNAEDQFEVASHDGIFRKVKATIKGEAIYLSTKGTEDPQKIRFAWGNIVLSNLTNETGLPASSFQEDL